MFTSRFVRWCTVLLIVMAIMPSLAIAQEGRIVSCDGTNCTVCDIAITAQNILNTGIFIAVALSAVLFAWGGWQYTTAGGDPGKASAGKEIFLNVGIGLILILAAWLIVDTIIYGLTGNHLWNKICMLFGQHYLA